MKNLSTFIWSLPLIIGIYACSAPNETVDSVCDPNGYRLGELCKQLLADAGADADADTVEAPGLNPSKWPVPAVTCVDRCVPEPSDTSAGSWPNTPLLVWIGPRQDMPAACPGEAPYEKYRRFSDLVAEPTQCDACTCASSVGTCAQLPTSIEIRTGPCNQSNVETVLFNGPAGWNGSCTSVNALPAGQLCNGVPCVQYVRSAALPAPTNEFCAPISEKPNVTKSYEWQTGALACNVKEVNATCNPKEERCVVELPQPWLHCVAREGVYSECPGNYNEMPPFVLYGEEPADDRDCSSCSCGAPAGSMCLASLSPYGDNVCTNEFLKLPLASTSENCAAILPAGRAIGSKIVQDSAYIAGSCAASGGEPTGKAVPNVASAVTFCCLSTRPPHKQVPN
jgi:hypothetical protein